MDKLDLSNSSLLLEDTSDVRSKYAKLIASHKDNLKDDRAKRRQKLIKVHDFYYGNQASYTTIVGRKEKEKQGHANAVHNYAGKTVKKIGMSMSNNPPNVTIPGLKNVSDVVSERVRAQGIEDFIDEVMSRNRFTKTVYVRGCFNQSMGDAAVKVYPVNTGTKDDPIWDIRIVNHERMDNILVGWRGDDPTKHDFVLTEEFRSKKSLEEEFGIKIPDSWVHDREESDQKGNTSSSWANDGQWDSKQHSGAGHPTGDNKEPGLLLTEYDDENYYCLMVENEFIEFVKKDGETYPKMGFWVFVRNVPAPRSPWSLSDIEDLMDPQIEFNEASNDERDYIRVGAAQKFVAYNMNDFDPESVKTGSGGVIFVNSDDNSARFEPLSTNVNVFPVDSYLNRIQDIMYDLGLPKVTFGSGGADSGRSKAIDYQSMVELLDFKRGQWELAITEIVEKIQIIGDFYYDMDFFKNPDTGSFQTRLPEFDWEDLVPVTKADQIVNVLNKFQLGLPFRYVFKELGYKDPDAIIDEMKRENEDEVLMIMRSKMYQLTGGVIGAMQKAQQLQADMSQVPANNPSPTMLPDQNNAPQPMATKNGTQVSYSSPKGIIDQVGQNLVAQGR